MPPLHVTLRDLGSSVRALRRSASRALVLSAAALTVLGGCAERRLATRPTTPQGAGTWAVVWIAGAMAALVMGVLLTLPAWQRRTGARLAVAVLTAQAGAAAVVGTLLAGVALRSGQLAGTPADAAASIALVRLSRVDGDETFFDLMLLVLLIVVPLVVTLTALAARFAAGHADGERWAACALLALELGGSTYAVVRLALGADRLPYLGGALAFPVIAAALASCWPRQPASPTPARHAQQRGKSGVPAGA